MDIRQFCVILSVVYIFTTFGRTSSVFVLKIGRSCEKIRHCGRAPQKQPQCFEGTDWLSLGGSACEIHDYSRRFSRFLNLSVGSDMAGIRQSYGHIHCPGKPFSVAIWSYWLERSLDMPDKRLNSQLKDGTQNIAHGRYFPPIFFMLMTWLHCHKPWHGFHADINALHTGMPTYSQLDGKRGAKNLNM